MRIKLAGDGNRTHMTSLEGWGFTIKLRPQKSNAILVHNRYNVNKNSFKALKTVIIRPKCPMIPNTLALYGLNNRRHK